MELNKEKMSGLIMDLYANPELKQNFLNDSKSVLKEKGFSIPEDMEIKAVEDTKMVKHIVLPYLDPGEKLTPEEMEARLSKSLGVLPPVIGPH